MALVVRAETPGDIAAIRAVTVAAFLDAPHGAHNEQFIIEALRESGMLTLSLVAEIDAAVVGHVAISPVTVADGASGWFGLGPVSVAPAHQQQGIGSRLVRDALRRIRDSGAGGCVVLGDPDYYSRFGFKPEACLVLPDVPPENFQVLSFHPILPRGVVTYHAAFGNIDA
jgi:putative acetyltransferase